jgi:predicted HNH restriction endonuclease
MKTQSAVNDLHNGQIKHSTCDAILQRMRADFSKLAYSFTPQVYLGEQCEGEAKAVVQNQKDQSKRLRAPALLVHGLFCAILEISSVLEPL